MFDEAGERIADAQRPVATARPRPGVVEQDPGDLLASVEAVLDAVAGHVDDDTVAGLACQRSSVVCWRRSTGEPLTPALSWQDTRADSLFTELGISVERVRAITGLPASAHYGATKLAWCVREAPGVEGALLDGDLCAGPLASFLLFRLLAEKPFVASHTLAQRLLLLDRATRTWSDELLDAFGLPDGILPRIVPDVGTLGRLRAGATFEACVGDQNAVPFASGAPMPGTLYVNAGTGAFVLSPLADGDAPAGLLASLLPRGGVAAEGTVNGAGSAIDWFEHECGHAFPWAGVDAIADGAPLFVNAVGDLGSPFWRIGARTRFEPDAGDRPARAYAVLESIAFLVRANVDRMRAHGIPVVHARVGGGLARSEAFCRLLAASLGCPVERAHDLEVTVRGVLTLLGGPADRADTTPIEAPAGWRDALDRRYGRWLELIG